MFRRIDDTTNHQGKDERADRPTKTFSRHGTAVEPYKEYSSLILFIDYALCYAYLGADEEKDGHKSNMNSSVQRDESIQSRHEWRHTLSLVSHQ